MSDIQNELGKLTSDLFHAKRVKAEHNAEIKKINADIREIEAKLLEAMQEQKLNKISGDFGTVYVARQVVPRVVNWDLFYGYIHEHGYFQMLERRPSRSAFQEQYELGQAVPGVEPVVFDEVRTRKN